MGARMAVRRFPLRTLLLMILALVAFARMWWLTHHFGSPRAVDPRPLTVDVLPREKPPDGGADR